MEHDIGHLKLDGLRQSSVPETEPHLDQGHPTHHPAESIAPPNPLQLLLDLSRRGDVVSFDSNGYGAAYLVNHPEYVAQVLNSKNYQRAALPQRVLGRGLVVTDGPFWQKRRRLMAPVFQQKRIDAFGPLIDETTSAMLDRWQSFSQRNEPVLASAELARLTLTIIGRTLFSVDLTERAIAITASVTALIRDLGESACTLFGAPLSYTPFRLQQFRAAIQTLDETAYDLINERRQRTAKPADLLSLLMDARDPETGDALTDNDVRDEVVTMLIAGHENTALMLAWTLYLLGTHPDAERRFYDEVDDVLEGRTPTVNDLPRLAYSHMVLQESLRLYPPIWQISRKALADDTIGGCCIPAGAAVVVSAYAMHRHPDYWDHPEQFLPDRFAASPSPSESRHRLTYFPFGGGPHHCIGDYFAMMEAQLILVTLAQRFRFQLVSSHQVEPEAVMTLRPRHGVLVMLEPRNAKSL